MATPTVYATFGSKRAILTVISDELSDETRRVSGADGVFALPDPRKQIAILAHFQRVHGDLGGDVLQMVRGAALVDPAAAAVVRERDESRRGRARLLARAWKDQGALRAGLEVEKAVDILWMLSDPAFYWLLVRGCGWSGDAFERWLADEMAQVLV